MKEIAKVANSKVDGIGFVQRCIALLRANTQSEPGSHGIWFGSPPYIYISYNYIDIIPQSTCHSFYEKFSQVVD